MQFTLKQLAYFAAVAEHSSITAAAQVLNISQPSVSVAVAQMERTLGIQLFIRRHARGLTLTPAGRKVLAEARNILKHAEQFESNFYGLAERREGILEVGCFTTIAPFLLPSLLKGFATVEPGIEVRPREGDHDGLMCGLLEGRFEIALMYHLGFPKELEFETLATVMPHAVLPAGHPLSSAVSVSLESLAREPMVLLDLPHSREYFLSLFRAVGLEPYVRDRTASFELVRGLVANGRGFSILNLIPRSGTTYEGSKVVCRPLSEQPSPLRVGLAQPAGLRLTHAARAFVAHCRCFFCQEATRPLLHPA